MYQYIIKQEDKGIVSIENDLELAINNFHNIVQELQSDIVEDIVNNYNENEIAENKATVIKKIRDRIPNTILEKWNIETDTKVESLYEIDEDEFVQEVLGDCYNWFGL